jgi:hypothetical protein
MNNRKKKLVWEITRPEGTLFFVPSTGRGIFPGIFGNCAKKVTFKDGIIRANNFDPHLIMHNKDESFKWLMGGRSSKKRENDWVKFKKCWIKND